jgi:NADH:ubiquinone oxidoreductase subunit 4 (subunit M)
MVSDWSFFSGAAESFDAAIPSTTDSENFDNYFGADPLADLLTFILVFLSVVVVFSGDDGTSDDRSYSNYSIFLFFLFQVLLDISISTVDLFLFFIAFEMFTIPMFLFFAICGSRDRRMRAFNYFF